MKKTLMNLWNLSNKTSKISQRSKVNVIHFNNCKFGIEKLDVFDSIE